jgi:hypothetical protein
LPRSAASKPGSGVRSGTSSRLCATLAIDLIGELMFLLRPDFACSSVVLRELRARVKSDAEHGPELRSQVRRAEDLVR